LPPSATRSGDRPSSWGNRVIFGKLLELARETVVRCKPVNLIIPLKDESLIRLAQPSGRLDERVEHGLKVESRAADDLEHIGGCSLLLQRLPQLVEQPHILDGDDGLVGEIGDQRDLLVVERSHLGAIDGDRADELTLLEHRHAEKGSNAPSSAATRMGSRSRYAGSAVTSATCTTCLVCIMRPSPVPAPGLISSPMRAAA
jgi:hypothetical protein